MKVLPVVLTVTLLDLFVTSDVIGLDYPWVIGTASRNHGYALVGHVFKTLSLFLPDCIAACQEKMNCFSINYADYKNGTFVCELNRSSKKRNMTSYGPKQHYEYIESEFCDKNGCSKRQALEDDWYMFNQSKFKLFYDKLSWDAAETHCESLGGNLASIQSETEEQFMQQIVLTPANNVILSNNLDQYSLYGNTHKVLHEGRMSLDFDGNGDYALIPSRDFRTTDFTISLWVYPRSYNGLLVPTNLLNNRDGANAQFSIYIWSNVNFDFKNVYGKQIATVQFPKGKTRLPTIEFGRSDGGRFLDGLLSDVVILPYAMNQLSIQSLKDGKLFGGWIGFHDKNQEGALQWSDGSPLSYMPKGFANTDVNDCTYLRKEEKPTLRWVAKACTEIHPFVCEKH